MFDKTDVFRSVAGFIFLSLTAYAEPGEYVVNKKAENYHKLLLKRPGNPTVFNRFVNAWLDTSDKKELNSWLKEKAETGAVSDLRILSLLHEYLGEDEMALTVLSQAVKKEPDNAEIRMVRAKLLARSLAFEDALKDLELASKNEKISIEAAKLKGVYLARSGQIKEAVIAWKEVIARFPNDVELREDLIELLVVEGLYPEAVVASKELVAMTKDPYVKVLRQMRLGDLQILASKREEGLNTYQVVLSATGEGTWIEREMLARLEKVYQREDNIKGLRDFYQTIREKYPRRISIQKALAYQMAATGEIAEAVELFREVLKITPGNIKNRQEFISFLETNDKWEEAKSELKDLLESRKNDVLLWQRLAQLEQLLENKSGTKDALDHVRDLKKEAPEGVIAVASLYDQADLQKEAEELLREGRTLFPDSVEIQEALASFLIQNKQEKEALTIWREMAQAVPRDDLLRVARSLTGHNKNSEAFSLLHKRITEFEDDVLILSQLCSLATTKEDANTVLPHALKLIKLATSPTDLESYMRLVVQVINVGENEQGVTDQLSSKTPLTIAECCLLAELFNNQGDTIGANKYLEQAEEIDQGLLAKFYRVHYNERRGNLDSSISIMESIVSSPEGRKTAYMRRLVRLLQSDGKMDLALTRIDEWKRMAPGDRVAWQSRVDILAQLGRFDEAVTETRRMMGKFGADEGLRASLASRLLEAGDYAEAHKIYEQLYDEADSLKGKLKWVSQLTLLAEKEGSLADLLESFDRRGRLNPESIEPLLAKAEIYHVLNQYDQRKEMLIEATRKRPNDAQLLSQVADVEERAGELNQAIDTLRQAVKFDTSFDSKRKLARLLIGNGETEAGLGLLAQIPAESSDPRKIEKILESLIQSDDFETAFEYLKKIPQHHEDWRLLYLKGVCLQYMGQEQEAYELFVSMKNVSGEIKGVTPLINQQQNSGRFFIRNIYLKDAFKGWGELTQYVSFFQNENSRLNNIKLYGGSSWRSYGGRSLISLPGTAREASLLGLLRAATIAQKFPPEKRQRALARLSIDGVEELGLFLAFHRSRWQNQGEEEFQEVVGKRLEEDPDNPILLVYWLMGVSEEQAPSKDELRKILAVIEGHSLVNAIRVARQMHHLKVLSEGEMVDYMLDFYSKSDEEEKEDLIPMIITGVKSKEAFNDQQKKRAEELHTQILKRIYNQEKEPKNIWWIGHLLNQLLSDDKSDEAINLINHLCKWEKERKNTSVGAGLTPNAPWVGPGKHFGYSRHGYQVQYLVPPPRYPTQAKGVHQILMTNIVRNIQQSQPFSSTSNIVVDAEQKRLWKLLKDPLSKKKKSLSKAQIFIDRDILFESLRGKTDKIENSILRALILIVLDDEAGLKAIVQEFEKSEDYHQLLMAAGYYHDLGDNEQKTYEILKQIAKLPGLDSTQRKQVDGYLVYQAALIAADDGSKADLEPAKRAALRLRKTVTAQEKIKLISLMKDLGLTEEIERMALIKKRVISATRISNQRRRPVRGKERSAVLIREGKTEEAVRESVREIRRLLKQGRNGRYQLNEYVAFLKNNELVDVTIEEVNPGVDASFARRLNYAQLCKVLGKNDQAYVVYRRLLKERPRSTEAYVGWVLLASEEDSIKRMLMKDEGGKVDFQTLSILCNQMNTEAEDNVDTSLRMMSLLTKFLKQLEPNESKNVNLSWANYFILRRIKDTSFQDYSLASLLGGLDSRKLSDKNAEKTADRDRIAKHLFISMIRHAQTAEQGFILLESSKTRLKITEEELRKFAKMAAQKMFQTDALAEHSTHKDQLWHRTGLYEAYGASGPRHSVGPIDYLTSSSLKAGSDALDEELLAKIEKYQPEKFKRMTLVKYLNNASEKEALVEFEKWKKSLPESVTERQVAIHHLMEALILSHPKNTAWTRELQKLFVAEDNRNSSSWESIGAKWANWLMLTQGSDVCEDYLEQLLINHLAPKEKWPILIQLGNRRLPSNYRQQSYRVQALFDILFADPLVANTAAFKIIDNNLIEVFSNMNSPMRAIWRSSHQSPENFIKWLIKNEIIKKRTKGEAFSAGRVFFVWSGCRQVRFKDSKMKEAAVKLLRAEKSFDPMLAQIMAAKFLDSTKGREIIAQTIAANPKDFAALKVYSKSKTQVMLRDWFPDMTADTSTSGAESYLKSFRKDSLEEAKLKTAAWMKDGIVNAGKSSDGSEYIPYVLEIIEDDPHKAVTLWTKILSDLKKEESILAGSSFSRPGSSALLHRWHDRLARDISSGRKTKIQPIKQIKFFHHLYHGEVGQYLLEPSANHSSYGYNLWKALEVFSRDQKFEKGKEYQGIVMALDAWAKELTEEEQATMVVMLQKNLSDRIRVHKSKDRIGFITWVTERYADQSNPIALAMQSFGLSKTRSNASLPEEEMKKQKQKAREFFSKLLDHEGLSVVMRTDLLYGVTYHSYSRDLLASEKLWRQVIKLMSDYKKGDRVIAGSYWPRIISQMEAITFEGRDKVSGLLASEAEVFVLSLQLMGSSSYTSLTRSILMLGLEAGDKKIIRQYMNINQQHFRGNLQLMMSLVKQGEKDLVKRLIAPNDLFYSMEGLGVYDAEFKRISDLLLTEFPNRSRYRVEVLLANVPDAADPKPEVSKQARLIALAERYKNEKLESRLARLEVLAILAADPKVAAQVEMALSEEAARISYGKMLLTHKDNQGKLEANKMKVIINRVNLMDVQAGRYDGIEKHLKSLRGLSGTDEGYQAARSARDILQAIVPYMLVAAGKNREEAKKILPLTSEVLKNSTLLAKHSSGITRYGWPVSVMIYCLADETGDFDAWMKSLPPKALEAHEKYLKSYNFVYSARSLASSEWNAKDYATIRRKVFTTLLNSEWFCSQIMSNDLLSFRLTKYQLLTVKDFYEVIAALPDTHSRKSEFLCEKARLMIKDKKELEKVDAIYAKAYNIAKSQKNKRIENKVLLYRSAMFSSRSELDRARKWGEQVKREMLSEKDLKLFVRESKKWKTAVQK